MHYIGEREGKQKIEKKTKQIISILMFLYTIHLAMLYVYITFREAS